MVDHIVVMVNKKTNQQAFESIQSQLGPDGVKGLQADTQALANSRKELMETMKSLEPMMNTAKGVCEFSRYGHN